MGKAVLLISAKLEERKLFRLCLRNRYESIEPNGLEQACREFELRRADICLLIADIEYLEQIKRAEVLEFFREVSTFMPVIAYSSGSDEKLENAALDMGVSEIVHRPLMAAVLLKRIENTIKLFQLEKQANCMRKRSDRIEGVFASVVENRSMLARNHAARIRRYTEALVRCISRGENAPCRYSEKQIMNISDAATLHDIGKIAVPDTILQKPGPLSKMEFDIVKLHTVKGCELLCYLEGIEDAEFLACCRQICRSHHERYDGGGYPDGLSGEELPIWVQAVGIADVYDALISKLVYKAPIAHDKAVEMIASGQCGVFEPHLMQAFVAVAEQFRGIAQAFPN